MALRSWELSGNHLLSTSVSLNLSRKRLTSLHCPRVHGSVSVSSGRYSSPGGVGYDAVISIGSSTASIVTLTGMCDADPPAW